MGESGREGVGDVPARGVTREQRAWSKASVASEWDGCSYVKFRNDSSTHLQRFVHTWPVAVFHLSKEVGETDSDVLAPYILHRLASLRTTHSFRLPAGFPPNGCVGASFSDEWWRPQVSINEPATIFKRPHRPSLARIARSLRANGRYRLRDRRGECGLAQLLGVSIRLANPPDECPGGNPARISSKFAAKAGAQRATVSWPYVKTPRAPHDAPPQFHIISVSPDKRGCTRLVLSMHALMAGPSTTHQANGWYPPVISLGSDDPVPPQPLQWNVPQAQSSYRVDTSDLGNRSKLRKVERACDHCRKRKAKCDGPQRKDHICSSCEASARTCTYLWVASSLSLFMR